MNNSGHSHVFWGSFSPLASLSGGGLLIMASSRLAWAISTAGALLWVSVLSVLAAHPLLSMKKQGLFPRQGRLLICIFLSWFIGSLYLLLLWFASPLAALEIFFPLSLIPLFCAGGGLFSRVESLDMAEALSRGAREGAVMGALIIVFALIREPLGYASLSLPGSARGMVLLFSFEGDGFFPVRIIASSAGALLLLGYGAALYLYSRHILAPREGE